MNCESFCNVQFKKVIQIYDQFRSFSNKEPTISFYFKICFPKPPISAFIQKTPILSKIYYLSFNSFFVKRRNFKATLVSQTEGKIFEKQKKKTGWIELMILCFDEYNYASFLPNRIVVNKIMRNLNLPLWH